MTGSGIVTECGLTQSLFGLAGEAVNDILPRAPDPLNMRPNTPSAIPPYAGYGADYGVRKVKFPIPTPRQYEKETLLLSQNGIRRHTSTGTSRIDQRMLAVRRESHPPDHQKQV
jgi:hypothetical protein